MSWVLTLWLIAAAAHADDVDDAIAALPRDPPIDRVVEAALVEAGLGVASIEARASRARVSGWAPVVRVGARRGRGQDLTALQTDTSGRLTRAIDDDLGLEVTLSFDLSRVVYGPDEVAWAREARARQDARAMLIEQVITVYFRRRRLMLERELERRLIVADSPVEAVIEREMALAETEALLDSFTGGRFARMVPRRRPPPRGESP